MKSEFVIEKNIPLPKTRAYKVVIEWLELAERMEPGDSVVLKSYDACNGLRDAAISLGRLVVSRIDRTTGRHRCWMVGPRSH